MTAPTCLAASTSSSPRRLGYQPALDGLRGVALLGVVAYHAGIDWLRGGFLGVSAFFTLSGFLITSLLLTERVDTGRVALGSFWTRRIRRLLPAALLTVVVTVLLAAATGDDSQLSRVRLDALSSLFHFSNWRFIVGGDNYGALFDSPSFFRHFWSLAVEEQYYAVFPLAVAGGLRLWRGPGRGFAVALGVATAAAVVWPIVLFGAGASTDRLYFGTDTRLAELLLGALLAKWWVGRRREVPDRPVGHTIAAGAAMIGMAAMWTTAEPDTWFLYRGGLAFHSTLTLVVIVAAIAPRGPVRALLSAGPLRRIGVISYGMYLFHWPVLLLLQQETSLESVPRFVVGLAMSGGLAELSHRFVEQPIRRGSGGGWRVALAIPASLAAAVVVVVVSAWYQPAEAPIDFAAVEAEVAELAVMAAVVDGPAATPSETQTQTPGAETDRGPVRVAGFGDSTALMTGLGVAQWADDHPDRLTPVVGQAKLGCGVVTGGTRRLERREFVVPEACDDWLVEWAAAIRGQDVDVSMVQLGAWDIVDHQLEPGGPFLAIGRDARYEAALSNGLEAAMEMLLQHSDVVMLLAHPDIGQGRLDTVPPGTSYPEYDPARSARWRELIRETAAANPDVVVVDLAGWVDAHPDDLRLRLDGVHFTYEGTREVADWLAPEILARYEDWRSASR